ncbi:MAG TPA: hypothetical protein VFQ39_03215 [Longimicrobium sp.]|nr:hypothetical protein [Longimicrobium sp.]
MPLAIRSRRRAALALAAAAQLGARADATAPTGQLPGPGGDLWLHGVSGASARDVFAMGHLWLIGHGVR